MIVSVAWFAFGLTIRVRTWEGPVVAEPSHEPTIGDGGNASVPTTVNVYVPGGVKTDVVTLSEDVAELLVVRTGLVPNTAVAPDGRPLVTLRVVSQGLVFPAAETVTAP